MKSFAQNYIIVAPLEKVWKALTDPTEIEKWGGGPAKMDELPGSKFSLWGGDIHGTNIEVVHGKKLVQDWYSGTWEAPSRATFTLSAQQNGTKIELVQENIPDEEFDNIRQGWDDYYIGPMKQYLEHLRKE